MALLALLALWGVKWLIYIKLQSATKVPKCQRVILIFLVYGGNGGNGGKVFNVLFTSVLKRKKTAKRVAERVAERT